MSKNKTYIIIVVVLVLAFFAGNLIYPQFLKGYFPERPFKLGLDLQGGTHLIYEADLSNIKEEDHSSSMQGLRDILERRVDLFGVREPIVQTQERNGHHRLIIELAGVDPSEAIEMIGQTPFLEFKEQRTEDETQKILDKQEEIRGKPIEEFEQIENWQIALQDPHFKSTPLTGKYLKRSELGFDQPVPRPIILLQFNEEGAKIFEEITSKNIGRSLAIYIDGAPISIPVVQEKISGGRAQITGQFSVDEARALVRNLNAGALPVPITLISQQSVGPTLGAVSLQESLRAGIIGFILVILFMIFFYRLPGVLAALALGIYVILVLALFALIPITLTLAGIGGIILSIGLAVDANILIFSRMKEELREQKSLGVSIEEGFRRAWPSIRDGNFTTLIVALILFSFGTGFVKGFALALTIGILMSMFSAIIITKSFLKCFVDTRIEKVKLLWP